MLRRMLIAVAALLSAFALSIGPASANVNDVHLYSQPNAGGIEFIDSTQTPSGCVAAPFEVRSAVNHWTSGGMSVEFYDSQANCIAGSEIVRLAPGQTAANLPLGLFWYALL